MTKALEADRPTLQCAGVGTGRGRTWGMRMQDPLACMTGPWSWARLGLSSIIHLHNKVLTVSFPTREERKGLGWEPPREHLLLEHSVLIPDC